MSRLRDFFKPTEQQSWFKSHETEFGKWMIEKHLWGFGFIYFWLFFSVAILVWVMVGQMFMDRTPETSDLLVAFGSCFVSLFFMMALRLEFTFQKLREASSQ